MYSEYLIKAGLSAEQSLIYQILLKNGRLSARKVQILSPFKRGLVYKLLVQLVEIGLISKKEEPGTVASFFPSHPTKLRDLAEKKETEAKDAQLALSTALPLLISDFNLVSGQPGVSFFEGIEGLTKIYNDIIAVGKDVTLFRSIYDDDHPELAHLVQKQIRRQVEKKIHTLALTPLATDTAITITEHDEDNLVTRRVFPREKFILNSQIIIYGQKVAIVSLKSKIISTLIDNEDISDTFRVIFSNLWELSKPSSDQYFGRIRLGSKKTADF